MQNLIEYPILREMKIIKALVVEKAFMNDQEVAMLNNCSLATARNDIELINDKYKEIFDVKINNRTIEFKNKSISIVREVTRSLFNQSITIQILLSIFYNPGKGRQYHCENTRISEASFYRTINNINYSLNPSQFSIIFRNKGYYLHGSNELDLRRFMVSLLIESKNFNDAFIEIPFDTLYDFLINYTLKDLPYKFEMQFYYYTFYAYITLLRETQGFSTNIHSIENRSIEGYTLLKTYFPDLNPKHLIALKETLFAQIYPWRSTSEKKRVEHVFMLFIKKIQKDNGHICTDDMHEQLLFISHCTLARHIFFPESYVFMFDRTEIFATLFSIKNPSYYQDFFNLLQHSSRILNRNLEGIAKQLLFWFHMICPSLYLSTEHPQVKVMSDIGKEHELFLKNILKSLFSSVNILDNDDEKRPDFIISNFAIEHTDVNIIYIRDYPLKEDLLLIYDQIQQVYSSK